MTGPVAVQLRTGPVHLAFAVDDAHLVAVCGARFGSASAVASERWTDDEARVCDFCDAVVAKATSVRQLRRLAGL